MISPARRIAFDVLLRVETHNAFAGELLYAAAPTVDARDAGLASEIVLGSLRRQPQLDSAIEQAAGKALGRLDPEVRVALRMGIYQLRHLDRVPAHAAVTESVELVKRARKSSAAGLVNAVLRKAPRGELVFPSEAVRLSTPEWMLDRWIARWGRATAVLIAESGLLPAPTYIRLPAGTARPQLELEATAVPGAFKVLAGDTAGARIQDIGSQWVVTLLDARPGHTLLDLCAAPGNKTAQALESQVHAIACDRHLHRLRALKGLECPRVVLDATQPLPFQARFDRILVDAPCSGTGTLARNPEIKWRLRGGDLIDLHQKQVSILRNALSCLKPGGRLIYSTCSLEKEENEDVVDEAAGGQSVETFQRLPGRDEGDGFFAAVIGHATC